MSAPLTLGFHCFAKLNLTLEVLGRRDDGYHEVVSLVHTISLADDLTATDAADLACETEGMSLPTADDNLVLRAARLLAGRTGSSRGAHLRLRKRIPVAAGLGGGSSDAAATLAALRRLWGLRLSRARLSQMAAQLGSDVPLFLRGGAALATGRGETVQPLPPAATAWCVLVVPPHAVPDKTRALYQALRPADFSDGRLSRQVASHLATAGPGPVPLTLLHFHNAFARPAREVFPGLDDLWRRAEHRTHQTFHLSGAGPSLFTLLANATQARQTARCLAPLGVPVLVARTTARGRAPIRIAYP